MKVIISMSGLSSRFSNAGYTIPKFMIQIDGKRVIEHIIDLYPEDSDFLFLLLMINMLKIQILLNYLKIVLIKKI